MAGIVLMFIVLLVVLDPKFVGRRAAEIVHEFHRHFATLRALADRKEGDA